MATNGKFCQCECHGAVGPPGAPVDSALEAAIACDLCRDAHAPALLGDLDKPLELPPKDKGWEPEPPDVD